MTETYDTMSATYDRLMAEPEAPDEAPSRDERGRFASKLAQDTPAVEPAPAEAVETTEDIPDQGTTAEPVEAETPIDPPASWSADEKEHFGTLPPAVQKALVRRESEREASYTQKSQEAARYKQYEPLETVLAPRRQQWAQEGMSPEQALQQLLALSDYASSDPRGFVQWFAQQRGISLTQPQAEPLQQPEGSPDLAPHLAPIVQDIQSIKQQLQLKEQQAALAVVSAFAQDPAHPHFAAVEPDMLAMIPAVRQAHPDISQPEVLKKAYDQAIWANPAVREQLLAAQRAAQEAERKAAEGKRQEEQRQAALKAQKAAGTQLGTRSPLDGGVPAPASARESMERAYDRLMGTA